MRRDKGEIGRARGGKNEIPNKMVILNELTLGLYVEYIATPVSLCPASFFALTVGFQKNDSAWETTLAVKRLSPVTPYGMSMSVSDMTNIHTDQSRRDRIDDT
jgi:hypothetical protein